MSKRLPPIPTPWSLRWREFRVQALPVIVFGVVALAVVYLWDQEAGPSAIMGEVEATVSEVTSPGSGYVSELYVSAFGEIEAGEPIARVMVTPPDVLEASLAVLRAEIELTRLGWIDPVLDQQRNALQREELTIDWLSERADLAIQKVRLAQAERDFRRAESLFDQGLLSEDLYEQTRTRVETLEVEVREREGLVEEMARALDRLRVPGDTGEGVSEALRATLELQEERLRLAEAELRPVTVVSPIGGIVSDIYKRDGEYVTAGGNIATVRSSAADRIVAYVRQPLTVKPEVGMAVEISTRRREQKRAAAEILAVGSQIQEMVPALQRPFFEGYESGLPVVVNLPPELELVPGEIVDIRLR